MVWPRNNTSANPIIPFSSRQILAGSACHVTRQQTIMESCRSLAACSSFEAGYQPAESLAQINSSFHHHNNYHRLNYRETSILKPSETLLSTVYSNFSSVTELRRPCRQRHGAVVEEEKARTQSAASTRTSKLPNL
jgi:hypothetical protein